MNYRKILRNQKKVSDKTFGVKRKRPKIFGINSDKMKHFNFLRENSESIREETLSLKEFRRDENGQYL